MLGSSGRDTGASSSGARWRSSTRVSRYRRGGTGRFHASRSPSGPAPQAPARRATVRSRVISCRTGERVPAAGVGVVSRSTERSTARARAASSAGSARWMAGRRAATGAGRGAGRRRGAAGAPAVARQ
ncbi:hypothetical protein HGI15_10505 [Modestobacter lapidis]|nr:hypothetical protein [Modestobacter lapidis]